MRNVIGATVLSLILAACGGPTLQETATSVPKRDLTLTTATAPGVQVTSGIELATTRPIHRSRSQRPAAPVLVASALETPEAQPAAVSEPTALPEPAPLPAAAADVIQPDPSGRELAPGATVTVIPVSGGGSSGGDGDGVELAEMPAQHGHGGVVIGGWPGRHCGSGGGDGPVAILR